MATCGAARRYWVGDTLLSAFVLYPLMVFYWRGIWDLVGYYIFPNDELKNCWTIFGIGCGTIFGYFVNPLVGKELRRIENKTWHFVVKRLYMAVFSVFPMAYWRGVWTLADYYLNTYGWRGGLVNYFICDVIMHVLRIRQTTMFPPLVVALDTEKNSFSPHTRFHAKFGASLPYIFDSLFCHFIGLTLTILLWRGGWTALGAALSWTDKFTSDVFCLGVGYAATLAVLFAEPLFLRAATAIARRHEKNARTRFLALLAWEDFVYYVAFWAHLVLWRGSWHLVEDFVVEDDELGGWTCNLVGTVGFLVCQVYRFVFAIGVVTDGWLDGTQERFFPTEYLVHVVAFFRGTKTPNSSEETEPSSSVETAGGYLESNKIYSISQDKADKLLAPQWSPESPAADTRGSDNKAFEAGGSFTHL